MNIDHNISDEAKGLRAGIADRAIWFHLLLDAAQRQGADAETISQEALTAFGRRAAEAYGKLEKPADFVQAMDQGTGKEAFQSKTISATDNLAVLRLHYCPLVEAWRTYGLPPERVEALCRLTQYGDCGRLWGTPLRLEFTSLISRGAEYCEIHVMPQKL
jgi:hypothetical protein